MLLRSRIFSSGSASPPFCPSSIQASWIWDSLTSPTLRASWAIALASKVAIELLFFSDRHFSQGAVSVPFYAMHGLEQAQGGGCSPLPLHGQRTNGIATPPA